MKKIFESWRKYTSEPISENKLRVFDFDDTLAKTGSKILLTRANGEVIEQSPGEWAIYEPAPDDQFDFSQFGGELIEPEEIKGYTNILRNMLKAGPEGRKIVILTARDPRSRQGILNFLSDIEIDSSMLELVTLGSSDPTDKAQWIASKIEDGYDDILFFDDSEKNVKAVDSLRNVYPHIKLRSQLV
jgi:hypothetical protein